MLGRSANNINIIKSEKKAIACKLCKRLSFFMLFIQLFFICFTAYMQLVTPSEVAMADVPPNLHAWKKIYLALRENKFSLKEKYICGCAMDL